MVTVTVMNGYGHGNECFLSRWWTVETMRNKLESFFWSSHVYCACSLSIRNIIEYFVYFLWRSNWYLNRMTILKTVQFKSTSMVTSNKMCPYVQLGQTMVNTKIFNHKCVNHYIVTKLPCLTFVAKSWPIVTTVCLLISDELSGSYSKAVSLYVTNPYLRKKILMLLWLLLYRMKNRTEYSVKPNIRYNRFLIKSWTWLYTLLIEQKQIY